MEMSLSQDENRRKHNFREQRAAGTWRAIYCEEGERQAAELDERRRQAADRLATLKKQAPTTERLAALLDLALSLEGDVSGELSLVAGFDDGRMTPASEGLAGWASLDSVNHARLDHAREMASIQQHAIGLARSQLAARQAAA